MKLLGSLPSPYVRKVRICLAEKRLGHTLELVDVMPLRSAAHAFHPLGKIPCLLLDDGTRVYDSRVICEYVDAIGEGPALIPSEARARMEVKRLEALADGVTDAGILVRWELTQRASGQRDPAWLERQEHKIGTGLEAIAALVGESRWCWGDRLSLADIAVGTCLGWLQFRMPGTTERHPPLRALYDRLMERPSFAQTAPVIA